eukprot:SAG31_NODE_5383_length_2572_cov_5.701981_1_plen_82_part_00
MNEKSKPVLKKTLCIIDIVDVADVAESTIAEAIKHFDANGDDKISSNEAASYFTKFLNMEKHGEYGPGRASLNYIVLMRQS